MSGMDTDRTTHLELLRELRAEAVRLEDEGAAARTAGEYAQAARLDDEAADAWNSYHETKAGTQ